MDQLKSLIREVPDFPKPGINFYDITTLLKNAEGMRGVVDALCDEFRGEQVDTVIGIEARGFIFAPAMAYHLDYGQDALQIHRDAVGSGHRVIIADDLLATGGTAGAVVKLVEQLGGQVVGL